jgi:hypothetical protein
MIMWLFQEWRLTHSCKANNRPRSVNAPTKTTGCKKGDAVRPLIVRSKFSGEPCAFYANCMGRVSGAGERKQLTCRGSIRRIGYTSLRKITLLSSFLIDVEKRKRVVLMPGLSSGSSRL